jgi:hypothetical protein
MVWVRERTIPTVRPPLVGEVIANFCGYRVPRGQRDGSLRPYSRFSRQESLLTSKVIHQYRNHGTDRSKGNSLGLYSRGAGFKSRPWNWLSSFRLPVVAAAASFHILSNSYSRWSDISKLYGLILAASLNKLEINEIYMLLYPGILCYTTRLVAHSYLYESWSEILQTNYNRKYIIMLCLVTWLSLLTHTIVSD